MITLSMSAGKLVLERDGRRVLVASASGVAPALAALRAPAAPTPATLGRRLAAARKLVMEAR